MRKYYADITKGLTAAAQQNHRREVGDPAGEAATLSNMALLSARMERVPEAIGRTIFFPGILALRPHNISEDCNGKATEFAI